jgi:hypothetical protein
MMSKNGALLKWAPLKQQNLLWAVPQSECAVVTMGKGHADGGGKPR